MSASSTCSRSARSGSTASSWPAGRRTRTTPFSARCARRRRWSPMRSSIGFVLVSVLLCVGSLNLSDIVEAQRHIWFAVPLLPMFVVFFISGLAETNRAAVRPGRGRDRTGGRLFRRIFGDGVRAVLSRRIRQHDPDECDDQRPVSRRLARRRSASRHSPGFPVGSGFCSRSLLCCSASCGCVPPSRASAMTS